MSGNFFKSFVRLASDSLMIISPIISYGSQGMKFKQTKSSEGFSKYMCLVLILSNSLRIFFWMGKHFTIVLLFQSCIVIGLQFFLIHMCLKYASSNLQMLPVTIESNSKEEGRISKLNVIKTANKLAKEITDLKSFWKWTNELNYYVVTIVFLLFFYCICCVIGFDNMLFIDTIGLFSAGFETVIAMPQIKENFKTRNTRNISFFMVSMWLVGDVFKCFYYIMTSSPIQLVICGFFQVLLDIILTTQVFLYNQQRPENQVKKDSNISETETESEIKKTESEDLNGDNKAETEDIIVDVNVVGKKDKSK